MVLKAVNYMIPADVEVICSSVALKPRVASSRITTLKPVTMWSEGYTLERAMGVPGQPVP